MSVLSILKRLEATASRNEKEAILEKHESNETLKEAFRLALDPTVNFYIKQIPAVSENTQKIPLATAFKDLVDDIATRKVRGSLAKERVSVLLGSLTPDDREVLKLVIGRNLRCGVSESTVEKIWPDLQLSYPCQLVSPMNGSTKLKFPMMAQTKMDGMRFNAIVENGAVSYRSRNGKELDLFEALDEDFLVMADGADLVFDGELLVSGAHGKVLDRKTGNGLLTKFQKGTGTEEVAKRIRAVVWDRIPLTDFRRGSCKMPCWARWTLLNEFRTKGIRVAQTTMINSLATAQALYQEKLSEGEEGLILKDPEGPWENKRVKHQLKMKAELEADLLCTGVTAGTGKYHGMIGALEIKSADGKVKCSVGTGLSDEERRSDPSEFIGKVVAVKYNALITDKKTGLHSLFLPVFVEVRLDKDAADTI
jgi:ATP-dependent DNA ligase